CTSTRKDHDVSIGPERVRHLHAIDDLVLVVDVLRKPQPEGALRLDRRLRVQIPGCTTAKVVVVEVDFGLVVPPRQPQASTREAADFEFAGSGLFVLSRGHRSSGGQYRHRENDSPDPAGGQWSLHVLKLHL